MNKPKKAKSTKINKTKCPPFKCVYKEHGDQICEAIRKPESSDDHSICYMTQVCDAFCYTLDSDGRSALHTAALVGKNKVVHYLATHGANVNLQDGANSQTPLHFAILAGNIGTALILLRYGAGTKILDKHGYSPTHYIVAQQPHKLRHRFQTHLLQGYSWGINANYNLGLASGYARESPEYFEVPLKKGSIFSASMNKFHTVFLSSNGKVFVCGHGHGGRLGFKTDSSVIVPQYLKVSKHEIRSINAGVDHTLFLNKNNEVFSCGINKYHQLGFSSCLANIFTPQVLQEWHSKNSHVIVEGIAAGAYHSVIWSKEETFTCGLNAGQLGHADIHNETFIDIPKSINYITNLNKTKVGEIVDVAVSDGSTVVLTSLGNVIACYEYKTHFIPLKAQNVKKIACYGGIVGTGLEVELFSDHKDEDLKIAILLQNGDLFVWSEKSTHRIQKGFEIWEAKGIFDFCINSQNLCLVDIHGEVYSGKLDDQISINTREQLFELINYQYFCSKGLKCIKSIIKEKKILHLYRTHAVFSDTKGNNFIALQYDPRLFIKRRFIRIPNTLRQDISHYYKKVTEFDSYFDVEINVNNRCFPAHAFILSYNSATLNEKLTESLNKKDNHKSTTENMKISLEGIDVDAFEEALNIMYFNDNYKGMFHKEDRFVRFTAYKDVEDWRIVNFVRLVSEGENGISEAGKKQLFLKGNKKKNINYPLKNLKELSCTLKIKGLQELLIFTNVMDLQNNGIIKHCCLSEFYALEMVYKRDRFPEFWDVSFKCQDGEIVRAHRFILMSRCSYFDALLGFRWNQGLSSDVVDINIPSNILIPLLDFLYTNEAPVVTHSNDLEFLCKILMFSHQYMIEGVHVLCQKSIFKCLTLKNCFDLLKFCYVYDTFILKDYILEFICLNMSYYFDNKIPKDLEEKIVMEINEVYKKKIRPSEFAAEDKDVSHTIISKDNFDWLINNDRIEDDLVDNSTYDSFYIPKKTVNFALSTNVQTTSLPSLEDLEIALKNNKYIVHQTLEEWVEEFKDSSHPPSDLQECLKSVRNRKSSSHKKRARKPSSSSQVSTSSNSESENVHEMDESLKEFSFEDMEDRLPKGSSLDEKDWKFLDITKGKIYESLGVERDFANLVIQHENQEPSSQRRQSPLKFPRKMGSILDDVPFPTLEEAMILGSVSKTSPPFNFTRLSKFPTKSKKESKKSQKKQEEEQKHTVATLSAWGIGSPEKYSSLNEIMRSESTTNGDSPAPKILISKDLSPIEPQQLKRISEEELCHWNPVTNTVIESPREVNDVSLSSIIEEEVKYTKHVEFEMKKPLSLIQLEEKAVKELYEFYGGEFNPEERITVSRFSINPVNPSWNIKYKNV